MLIAVISAAPVGCHAFDLNVYADTSALASGKWVKISTEPVGGIHFVSYRDLRRWGFGSPERVSVAGYGTLTDSDVLSQADTIDVFPHGTTHRDGKRRTRTGHGKSICGAPMLFPDRYAHSQGTH